MSATTTTTDTTMTTQHKRPFSIDLSLELERQLEESESLPSSPAPNADSPQPHRDSLDPAVLAHIVMQLRQSLADMTKERDDLLAIVARGHTKEAELKDALQLLSDKATDIEEELSEARKKSKDDDEAISLLRSKVEESRRGLMKLQTENRRHSVQPLDLSSRGSIFSSPPSAKRTSFTPLTGNPNARANANKRLSLASISVSDITLAEDGGQVVTLTEATPPTTASKMSIFGRSSPPRDISPPSAEMELIRKELSSVKTELEDIRAELAEATEAREASESCVKTLREFIAENNIGSGRVEAPPEAASPVVEKKPNGWGFGLWKVDTSVGSATPHSSGVSPMLDANATPTATTPLSRKIGGFFNRQNSISSNESESRARQSLDVRSDSSH